MKQPALLSELESEDQEMIATYLTKKSELLLLQEEVDSMKEKVLDVLSRYGAIIHTENLELAIGTRVTYEYSEEVSLMQETLRAMKREEEKKGFAKASEAKSFPIVRKISS